LRERQIAEFFERRGPADALANRDRFAHVRERFVRLSQFALGVSEIGKRGRPDEVIAYFFRMRERHLGISFRGSRFAANERDDALIRAAHREAEAMIDLGENR
jgi:hypothetical protein